MAQACRYPPPPPPRNVPNIMLWNKNGANTQKNTLFALPGLNGWGGGGGGTNAKADKADKAFEYGPLRAILRARWYGLGRVGHGMVY